MRQTPGRAVLASAIIAATSLLAAACSDTGESGEETTTSSPTPSAPDAPEGPGGPQERGPQEQGQPAEEPPEPAWILQVGTAADDELTSVAGRDDEVLAVGSTAGDLSGGSAGGADSLTLVADVEGTVVSTTQAGGDGDDLPNAVGNGSNSIDGDVSLTCGSTTSDLAGPNAGSTDAWCGRIGGAALESVHQQGSPGDDTLASVAIEAEATIGTTSAVGYAVGSTAGLFPGAADTSAGVLGNGDAMLWQLDADGFPIWIRQLGTESADSGHGAAVTPDGDAVMVGRTAGSLDGASNGGTDAFVTRFDPDGLPRWTLQFGSAAEDWADAVAAGGEPARGTETIVAVGGTTGALAPVLGADVTSPLDAPRADGGEPAAGNAGGSDVLLGAFDSTGDATWTAQLGSTGEESAAAVAIDGRTVLVAGTTTGALATNGDPAAGGGDGFLAALDRDTGTLRWVTQFGSEADERVTGLTLTETGLVVVSGSTMGQMGEDPNAGGMDGFLIAFPLPTAGGAVASAL